MDIKELRLHCGLTQPEAAQIVGIPFRTTVVMRRKNPIRDLLNMNRLQEYSKPKHRVGFYLSMKSRKSFPLFVAVIPSVLVIYLVAMRKGRPRKTAILI